MRHVGTSVFLSLALLTLGCGRLGFNEQLPAGEQPDAGTPGNGDAAAPPPTPLGPASMTRLAPSGALDNQPVVFHNPDGSLLSLEQTDSSGRVTRDVPENAMVTVVGADPFFLGGGGGSSTLFTVMGVQPEDDLSHGTTQDPWESLTHVEATLPGQYPGAVFYTIPTGCGGYAKADPMSLSKFDVSRACHGDISSLSLAAYAYDNSEQLVAVSVLSDVPFATDGPTQVTFPTWSDNLSSVAITLTDQPVGADGAEFLLGPVDKGVAYASSLSSISLTGMGDQANLPIPVDFGAGVEHLVRVSHYVGGAFRERRPGPASARLGGGSPSYASTFIHRRQSDIQTEIQYSVADDMPAPVQWLSLDTGDVARPVVSLSANEDSSLIDGGVMLIAWGNEPDWTYHEWWILFPPGTTQLHLPELPDSLASYRPNANSVFDLPYVLVFDADCISDYADMRNSYGFELFLDPTALPGDPDWLIKAATGPGGFPYSGFFNG